MTISEKMGILVIYWCVTSYRKTQQLKTTNLYLLPQFLMFRNLGAADLGWFWLKGSREIAVKLLAGAESERLTETGDLLPSSSTRQLAGDFSSLAHGHLLGLPMTWLLVITEKKPRQKLQSFIIRSQESYTISSAIFYWSHKPTLVQCEEKLYKDMNTRRQGALGAILEAGLKKRELRQSHLWCPVCSL